MEKRIFKLIFINNDEIDDDSSGKYIGRGPLQAARKAFNKYCSKNRSKTRSKNRSKNELEECTLTLQETTSGSAHKEYQYKGTRIKRKEPKIIMLENKKVIIKYDINIKSI